MNLYELTIKLNDQYTSPLQKLKNGLESAKSGVDSLKAKLSGLGSSVSNSFSAVSSGVSKIGASASGAINSVFSLRNALLGLGLASTGLSIIKTTTEFQSMNNAIKFASGSAKNGADNLEFIRNMSYELGFDLKATTDGFKTFGGAMMGSKFKAQEVRDMFKQVSYGAAVMGLSADDTKAAFLALGQMMGKGKVSAEELRGQLGERIPGAFQIAARSMGLTTAQLDKMMSDGKIMSEDFLPKFAKEMEKTFKGGADTAKNSLGSNINRLKNDFAELQIFFGTIFEGAINSGVSSLRNLIANIKIVATNFYIIENAFQPITQMFKLLNESLLEAGIRFDVLGNKSMTVIDIMQSFSNSMRSILNAILPYITPIIDRIPMLAMAVKPVFESIKNIAFSIIQNIQALYPKVLEFIDTIFVYIVPVIQKIITDLEPVFIWIVNSFGYFAQNVITFLNPIIKILSGIAYAIAWLLTPLIKVAGYVGTGFFDAFSWALGKIGQLIDGIVKGIEWMGVQLGLVTKQSLALSKEVDKNLQKKSERDKLKELTGSEFGIAGIKGSPDQRDKEFNMKTTVASALGVKTANTPTAPAGASTAPKDAGKGITGGGSKQTNINIIIQKMTGIETVNAGSNINVAYDEISQRVLQMLIRSLNGAQYSVETQ